MYIEILSKCNAKCAYCYNENEATHGNSYITLNLFRRIIEDAIALNISRVDISGGEPMLHEDLCAMLSISYDSDVEVKLITNFLIYNEDIYQLLCKHSIPLQLTLDGPSPELHNFTRGNMSYEKMCKNIERLYDMGYNGKIIFRINLHADNYLHIGKTIDAAKSLGASEITVSRVNQIGAGVNFDKILDEYDDAWTFVENEIENARSMHDEIEVTFTKPRASMGCPYYGNSNIECGFKISTNGYVFPCQVFMDKAFNLGNVKNENLGKILNGEKMNRFLTLMHLRKHFIPECQECAYKKMCPTGCPADAFNANKNIFSLTGRCAERKELMRKNLACFKHSY